MKRTKIIMGMPISVEIVGTHVSNSLFEEVFDYFKYVDAKYSTYKPNSEISRINRDLPASQWSREMKTVLALCEQTKLQTGGFFDVERGGRLDPSGLVKGWAVNNAADLLKKHGVSDFYIDAGGDIQVAGQNHESRPWSVGIRNPFKRGEIIKTVLVSSEGVATSGTAVRGHHIYNPHLAGQPINEVVSLTVIGPNIYEADRFATSAFAMGQRGLAFIEALKGFEGYMVTDNEVATMTSGFERYVPAYA